MDPRDRLIVGIDITNTNIKQTTSLVESLMPYVGFFKIGLSSIYYMLASVLDPSLDIQRYGDNAIDIRELLRLLNGRIFLDGKLAEIPDEMAETSRALQQIKIKMFSVHASTGRESVEAAVVNRGNSLPLGVTVLTSISEIECVSIFGDRPGPKVLQFARMLSDVGAAGVVCSGQEAGFLRQWPDLSHLLIMTPGVYPNWMPRSRDQKRVVTPTEAIIAGADYLIMRRSITNPPREIGGPVEAVQQVLEEIAEAS